MFYKLTPEQLVVLFTLSKLDADPRVIQRRLDDLIREIMRGGVHNA